MNSDSLNTFALQKLAKSEVILSPKEQAEKTISLSKTDEDKIGGAQFLGTNTSGMADNSVNMDLDQQPQGFLSTNFEAIVGSKKTSKNVTPMKERQMQNFLEGGEIDDLLDNEEEEYDEEDESSVDSEEEGHFFR